MRPVRRRLRWVAGMGSRTRPSISGKRSTAGCISQARRLKSLEDENGALRKLLAEAMLDNAALKDLLGKNG